MLKKLTMSKCNEEGCELDDFGKPVNLNRVVQNQESVDVFDTERQDTEDMDPEQKAEIAVDRYVKICVESGEHPLPVLNRICDGYLPLLNY